MRPRPFLLLIAGIALALFYTIPGASADAILNVDGEGFHDYTSFGPVGGTAVFYITVSNDGDADYEDASISASFDDESWTADKVNFDDGTNSGNATLDIGAIGAAESVVLAATVSIPESAENQDTVTFIATVDADGDIATREFTVVVTDWIAYSDDGSQSYEMGDTEEDCSASTSCNIYNITVMNLNEADISNEITIGFAGADEGGWLVGGDDWDEMNLSATLFGLDGNDKYVIELEITVQEGNIPAGDANLAFLAGDDSGYIQPYFIVMNANIAEFFDVRVFGGGSQSVAASGGEVSWEVTIQNMGNTGDNFDISFDTSGLPSGWSTTGTASENTGYLEWKGSGEASIHSFSVTMNVPDGLGAGTSGSFWMSVSSSSGATAADQSFSATVAQGYGLSLTSSANEATKAPGEHVSFLFAITNTGNGVDSYAVVVGGPSAYSPASDVAEVIVTPGGSTQFLVSATVPADKQAHTQSGDITVTVTSKDGMTTASQTVSVTTAQVFALAFDGGAKTVSVAQDASVSVVFNLTNSGNGPEIVAFALDGAPPFASLSSTSAVVGPGQTITVAATIAPSADDAAGSSTFTVTATGGSGIAVSSGTLTVDVTEKSTGGGDPGTDPVEVEPIASIDSVSPSPTEIGKTVFFNGTGSDSDGTVVAYLWESSIDGELSTNEDFSTSDLSLGHHTITFRVQDNDEMWSDYAAVAEASLWIYAVPIAIAGGPVTVEAGKMVQLFGQGGDDDGSIALYEWDFDGNGIYDWSSEDNGIAEFRYSSEGTYNAVLKVTDNDGYSSTSTMTISVEPASRIGQIAGIDGEYILGAALLIAIGIATAGYLMKRDSYVPPPASKRQPAPQFKPKTGLTAIECPGCSAQMKVPKLGKMQTVTCDSCGLSGEIEV